jgi:uncharacterized protein
MPGRRVVRRLTQRPRSGFKGVGVMEARPIGRNLTLGSRAVAAIAGKPGNPYIRSGIMGLAEHALETPCVNICLLDPATGTCLGCGRTLAEIASWAAMGDAERRAVMAALPARMERHEKERG